MSIIFDVLVVLIISLSTFLGYKRGLVKVVSNLVSFILAVIIALALSKPIAKLVIEKTEFDDTISKKITETILPEGVGENVLIQIPEGVPDSILKQGTSTVKEVSNTFSVKIVELVVLFVVYLIAKIILKFVTIIADLIAKLPIIKQVNDIGGLIYGVFSGFITCFVLLALLYMASPLLDEQITKDINNSSIASQLYHENLLLKLI